MTNQFLKFEVIHNNVSVAPINKFVEIKGGLVAIPEVYNIDKLIKDCEYYDEIERESYVRFYEDSNYYLLEKFTTKLLDVSLHDKYNNLIMFEKYDELVDLASTIVLNSNILSIDSTLYENDVLTKYLDFVCKELEDLFYDNKNEENNLNHFYYNEYQRMFECDNID